VEQESMWFAKGGKFSPLSQETILPLGHTAFITSPDTRNLVLLLEFWLEVLRLVHTYSLSSGSFNSIFSVVYYDYYSYYICM